MKVIKGTPTVGRYGTFGEATWTHYTLESGQPVARVATEIKWDSSRIEERMQRDRVALLLKQIRKNKHRWVCYYCQNGFSRKPVYTNPHDFLDWVEEKGFSLERWGAFFHGDMEKDGFVDFSGNVGEYSSAFKFRIYDNTLAEEIRARVAGMPFVVYF